MALEYVKAYLDDLLIISKKTLKDPLEKLRVVLTKLQSAGLKSTPQSLFSTLLRQNIWVMHLQEKAQHHKQKNKRNTLS